MNDRLFFDTNVLLDHLLDREPFADDATATMTSSPYRGRPRPARRANWENR